MFFKLKIARLALFVVFIAGCRSLQPVSTQSAELTQVNSNTPGAASIDSIIRPYKAEYNKQMLDTIAFSGCDMSRGRPEGKLSNLLADATLNYVREQGYDADMVMLNYFSIRTPLNEGPILRSELYEIMPFENTLVIATLSRSDVDSLVSTIVSNGGEPVSGIQISSNGSWKLLTDNSDTVVRVVTTNYVYNGGDGFTEFARSIGKPVELPVLIRDAWLEYFAEHYPVVAPACAELDARIELK